MFVVLVLLLESLTLLHVSTTIIRYLIAVYDHKKSSLLIMGAFFGLLDFFSSLCMDRLLPIGVGSAVSSLAEVSVGLSGG